MTTSMDDNFRVQEFVAHSTQVNCAAIGPRSNQVFATGGEDMKVNVWRVGSVSNIWTLGHNKSAVESLCFDSDEVNVISGAFNGSLKVYDLNEGKLARSLGSHQVGVTSIQYHPYGEFLVSGSSDCVMKFWDVRAKSCVESYTGHKKEITCVRFSPDGKWVASSSKDGQLIFYDLIASKHISTIKLPQNYITNFEFNPTDFSLAAITTARNVKLWDLESMKPIFSTAPESSNLVKAIAFSNLGTQLYTTAKSNLKCWDLDSSAISSTASAGSGKLIKSVEVGWESIVDMKVSNNDSMVAVSFLSNFVSVWELELSHFFPATGEDDNTIDTPAAVAAEDPSYPPEETKPSGSVNASGRGRVDGVEAAPAKGPTTSTGTASQKATNNNNNNNNNSNESKRGVDGNGNGMEGLYIAGSKFRANNNNNSSKEVPVTSGGPIPLPTNAPAVSINPITGVANNAAYYTKEVKLSHIRNTNNPNTNNNNNNNNPLYHYAADQKDTPAITTTSDDKQLPLPSASSLSARPLRAVNSNNNVLRTPTAATANNRGGSEISEHKAVVYHTPILSQQQHQQQQAEDEVIDEDLVDEGKDNEEDYVYDEREYRSSSSARGNNGNGNGANKRNSNKKNSNVKYGVEEEAEDEIEDEIEDMLDPPPIFAQKDLDPHHHHHDSRGGDQKKEDDEDEDEDEIEPEVVPEEGMSDASVSQDMATSMGESFWKRFHANQQQQQQGNSNTNSKKNAMVLGGEYHHEDDENANVGVAVASSVAPGIVLPPSNFGKPSPSISNNSNSNSSRNSVKSSGGNSNPPPVMMRSNSANANNANNSEGGGSRPSSTRLRTPNTNNTANNNNNIPIQVMAPPVRTPSSSSSATNNNNNNNEIMTCINTLDNLLSTTMSFQTTLSSRLITLKTLRSTYLHQSFPLFVDHIQVLLSTIQSYPTSPSSQPVFTALCDFLLTVSFFKANISLDSVVKVLPWCIQLVCYHYDTLNTSNTPRPGTSSTSNNNNNNNNSNVAGGSIALVVKSVFKQCLQLLQGFGELIRNTRSLGSPGMNHQVVDVHREERYNKCMVCYQAFLDGLTYSEKYLALLRSSASSAALSTPRSNSSNKMNGGSNSMYQEEEELLIEFQQLMKHYFPC